MQAWLAKNAGFCAGVRRAVKIARDSLNENGKWYSLGVLVHNDDVVNHFIQKGLQPVERLDQISDTGAGIIIRSHGVSPFVLKQAAQQGLKIRDATCPLVKEVHEIVARLRGEEYDIVIFGDINHPEVQGIMGWCDNKAVIVNSVDDLKDLQFGPKVGIVSQTTRDQKDYQAISAALLAKYPEASVFNTICPATRKRQEAARLLCQDVELMLVIGDKKSSNTRTLSKECISTGVKTFQVQNVSEIELEWLRGSTRLGITAGASTPDWIIKEVLDKMTAYDENNSLVENQEKMEQEVDSAESLANEESFAKLEAEMADLASPNKGDVIKGVVIQVLDDEVMVDVGGKSEGIVPLREMSVKDVSSAKELVEVGDEIEVMVLKWDDDGTILLSKKKVESKKVLDELEKSYQEGKVIEGTVTGSVKGGLLVDVGVVAFLPASHVDDGYVKNLEEYVNKVFSFKIIEFNRNKRRGSQIVLSRKELVAEEKAKLKKIFWEEIEEGQTRKGKIKRLVDYGAFIDLGGYEGLLHVSEIAHNRIAHPSNVLTEGDEIDIYILGVDREKERVSLSRKKLLKSPWEIVLDKYNEGDVINGTVVRIAPFGAFVEIEPGVDGLVHISQLANRRVEKPDDVVKAGEEVKVKILSIDFEEKRIGLSIKEAQNDVESTEVQEFLDNQNEE